MTIGVLRLLRVGLNVGDLDRASAFYRDALGFSAIDRQSYRQAGIDLLAGDGVRVRTERLGLGSQQIELSQFELPGASYPADSTAADLWFQHFAIVTRDMAAAYERLERSGSTPITRDGPQRLPPAAGSVVAYKFRDPDGHPLELIHFPPGGRNPVRRFGPLGPTTGIDHSAVSVADADRSVAFYSALGLSVSSREVNSGPAQDRLDGLSSVSVRVIGMLPADTPTPHVELLSYDNPRGRPASVSSSYRDIADSKLIFEIADLATFIQELALAGISPDSTIKDGVKTSAARLRDPDGHRLVLLQKA